MGLRKELDWAIAGNVTVVNSSAPVDFELEAARRQPQSRMG